MANKTTTTTTLRNHIENLVGRGAKFPSDQIELQKYQRTLQTKTKHYTVNHSNDYEPSQLIIIHVSQTSVESDILV